MKGLSGKKVVVTGSRRIDEMKKLVENFGGQALVRSLQGQNKVDEDVLQAELQKLLARPYDWFIFTTGVGVEYLHRAAKSANREDEFLEKLRTTKSAVRGYKTARYLKSLDVEPTLRDDDGTTSGLFHSLIDQGKLVGASVALQLYGEEAPDLVGELAAHAKHVETILPYESVPPNPSDAETLVNEIITAAVDAVTFTSAQQVAYFFDFTERMHRTADIRHAFNQTPVIAVAVGKVTAAALREVGIEKIIVPEQERMGAMIFALADHFVRAEPD